jgi:hypothetical protein
MKRPEQALQINLVSALRLLLPEPWLVVHVPNGGGRSKAEAGIFKAMGVLAGFPDLLVIGPTNYLTVSGAQRGDTNIIAIELKAPHKMLKSGKPSKAKANLSDAQRDVIGALGQCGIPTLVVHSLPEAIDALKALGVPVRGRAL